MKIHEVLDKFITSVNLRRYANRWNAWNTFCFNMRAFPLHIALKFPVYVYGSVAFVRVGKIEITTDHIHRGMIHLGEDFFKSTQKMRFCNWGTICWADNVKIRAGVNLFNRGHIVMEKNSAISENTFVSISTRLFIGENTRIGYNSSIVDSDDHYVENVVTHEVSRNERAVKIGHDCWLGSRTNVKKGTVLPDYTIVASPNALLTRNYTSLFPPYSIVGGSPVKLLKTGFRGIYSSETEQYLRERYAQEGSSDTIVLDTDKFKL